MEASDPSVSVDLLVQTLLAVGATRTDIAAAGSGPGSRRGRTATARGRNGQLWVYRTLAADGLQS
jgi:hypothetical protein